jgi:hypothetical protein
MVNNEALRIVAPEACTIVPTWDRQGTIRDKISNGPVYSLLVAQAELGKRKFFFVTVDAAVDQYDVLGGDNLRGFIAALRHPQHYVGSERCKTSQQLTPPPWLLDADGYAMHWNIDYGKEFRDADKYYVKFGFEDGNDKFLIVSVHESD